MNNKIVKLVAFCLSVSLMIFLPAIFSLGFDLYLDISMKSTGKLPTVDTYKKLEKMVSNVSSRGHEIRFSTDDVRFDSLDGGLVTNGALFAPTSDRTIQSSNFAGVTSGTTNLFSGSSLPELESSQDYSTTNTQVVGVDEADIIKNDGKYIYMIAENKLVIVEAFPAEKMKKLSESEMEKGYRAIDLYISGDKLFLVTDNCKSSGRYNTSKIETKVVLFDITDRSNPKAVKTFEFTGLYTSSRLIGNTIYLFSNMSVKNYGDIMIPKYRENSVSSFKEVDLKEVQYVPDDNYTNYTQIFAFDLDMPFNSPKIVTYLGSSAQNVYMSLNNLYIAQNTYNETLVYKFNLAKVYPRFEAKGSVPGSIINQFAMDEYNGNFRIATTKNNVSGVYVLSESMHRLGSVTNIARGEQIKSVRFEGNRGYVVTFRNTDPLFVIDLTKARAPKILGELKITGYSTYLHPYDENHVIGFGYDGNSWGTNGKLKIALFDITDVTNPKEKFKEVIDASTSELIDNHKALLFSKEKNLIAFPVGDYSWRRNDSTKVGKVYTINVDTGFSLRGEVKHSKDIERMLYMDDVLYGVSSASVSAHDINTIQELNKIDI